MQKRVRVNDKMQSGYEYFLTEPTGRNFDIRFKPGLTPKQMLALGVFGGRYMRDCQEEFPADWFSGARLHPENIPGHSKELNLFKVDASQPLSAWIQKGWIHPRDPRGWFQWYCRYYLGRRSDDDEVQIRRWLAMKRHVAQVEINCRPFDWKCRPKQRQALLHWAYDSRRI